VYESIVAEFREESEAYWGLVLCKYGIEYVDDPGTGKKIPTCYRSSFDSIMEDPSLLDKLRRHYAHFMVMAAEKPEIKLATLGNDAGIYGAARLALNL